MNLHVLEHRLMMEKKVGRLLTREEKVHHINGIRDDNRPENLELLSLASNTLRDSVCRRCPLRKEVRLLRWQVKDLRETLQTKLKEV